MPIFKLVGARPPRSDVIVNTPPLVDFWRALPLRSFEQLAKLGLKHSFILIFGWALMIDAFTGTVSYAHFPIPPKKTEIGRRLVEKRVKDFTLTDQAGKEFQLDNAKGKIIAATFVYTRCPDVCPLFTAKFAAIQRALEAKAKKGPTDYLLLTITTDPEYDSPKQLKSYADLFKPNYAHWRFLTGSRGALAKVWRDFGVNVRKTADGQVQHTALTTLIDRQGMRRVDYYGEKWHEKTILQDIISLAEQNQPAD